MAYDYIKPISENNPLPVSSSAILPAAVNGASYASLTVSTTSVGFTGWPTSGIILLELTCETADVYFSLAGAATANHPILRVGDKWIREVDAATIIPQFLRVGTTDGNIRAFFMKRI